MDLILLHCAIKRPEVIGSIEKGDYPVAGKGYYTMPELPGQKKGYIAVQVFRGSFDSTSNRRVIFSISHCLAEQVIFKNSGSADRPLQK